LSYQVFKLQRKESRPIVLHRTYCLLGTIITTLQITLIIVVVIISAVIIAWEASILLHLSTDSVYDQLISYSRKVSHFSIITRLAVNL
jgi:hypothetical protein